MGWARPRRAFSFYPHSYSSPTILYNLRLFPSLPPDKMERHVYVFCIQLSKSILYFQHDYSRSFKETNHVFSLAPSDRDELAAKRAVGGLCDPGLPAIATVF